MLPPLTPLRYIFNINPCGIAEGPQGLILETRPEEGVSPQLPGKFFHKPKHLKFQTDAIV